MAPVDRPLQRILVPVAVTLSTAGSVTVELVLAVQPEASFTTMV